LDVAECLLEVSGIDLWRSSGNGRFSHFATTARRMPNP
jgi:hypothetical protein